MTSARRRLIVEGGPADVGPTQRACSGCGEHVRQLDRLVAGSVMGHRSHALPMPGVTEWRLRGRPDGYRFGAGRIRIGAAPAPRSRSFRGRQHAMHRLAVAA